MFLGDGVPGGGSRSLEGWSECREEKRENNETDMNTLNRKIAFVSHPNLFILSFELGHTVEYEQTIK